MTARRIACARRSRGPMERRIRRAKASFSSSFLFVLAVVSTLPTRVLTRSGHRNPKRMGCQRTGRPGARSDEAHEDLVRQEPARAREDEAIELALEELCIEGPVERRPERGPLQGGSSQAGARAQAEHGRFCLAAGGVLGLAPARR